MSESMEVADEWEQDQQAPVEGTAEPEYQQEEAMEGQQQQQYHAEYGDQGGGGGGGDEEEDDVFDLDGDQDDQAAVLDEGVLLMRFCPHDSSMLYPQEDKRNRRLRHACRLCRYSEESQTPLIFRNQLKKEVGNVLNTVPSAVSDDPTLPRSFNTSCDNCGHNEAVFFQGDTSDTRSDSLALIFVCCNCSHKWVG